MGKTKENGRDYQRAKSYQWQFDYVWPSKANRKKLTRREIVEICARICIQDYAVAPPEIVKSHRTVSAAANSRCLMMPDWSCFPECVMHELAHYLVLNVYHRAPDASSHGAAFMRVYIDLLLKHCGTDSSMIWNGVAAFNLNVALKPEMDAAFQAHLAGPNCLLAGKGVNLQPAYRLARNLQGKK